VNLLDFTLDLSGKVFGMARHDQTGADESRVWMSVLFLHADPCVTDVDDQWLLSLCLQKPVGMAESFSDQSDEAPAFLLFVG